MHLLFFLLVSWTSWVTTRTSIVPASLQDRYVHLLGPKNVTVFYRSQEKLIIAWDQPPIFVPHDPDSLHPFVKLKPGDKIKGDEYKVPLVPTILKNGTSNSTELDSNSTTQAPEIISDGDTANLSPVVCRPLSDFADMTVGEKKAGDDDNGWAVSLLSSNVTLTHFEGKEINVAKFEEGCVKKFVLTYQRHGRRVETEISLNATDRLAVIDGLKEGTEYKVVVAAHFVSGHVLSAQAIFPSTLLHGQRAYCRCDWHGTKNLTGDCDSPNNADQVCDCSNGYAGRFCEVCAYGYFRDALDSGCKKCPCDEHSAVETSCSFVEGFLHCDKCAEGYTGNICHRCSNGYYRYKSECAQCHCNGNTLLNASLTCHPTTGACLNCQYNTSGFFCERCFSGYRRSPDHNNSCIHLADFHHVSPPSSSSSSMSSGVIIAIVSIVILCSVILIAMFVCKRVKAKRQERALWTVEMRPDNDDLDFNSVPNEEAHMDDVDDIDFYERQGGRSRSGGKYSKLNEEV